VGSAIWGASPLASLDLTNLTTRHLKVHISLSLHTTSATTASCLHAQAISSKYARDRPSGVKTPSPARSRQPGYPPPQRAYPPQPTHYLHHHRQLFACAGNIEQVHTVSAIWVNPPPPLDPANWASHYFNHLIILTPHITDTFPAS
jgi:hypothetical protein